MEERQYHWRRIPGTLVLAITNIIASLLLWFPVEFERSALLQIPASLAPAWVWGLSFLLCGLSLLASTIWRRWVLLNIGSAMSLFLWTFMTTAVIIKVIFGSPMVSPVAFALFFWMFAGQVAMLFVPLWAAGRGAE